MIQILLLLFLVYYVKESFKEIKHELHGKVIDLDFMVNEVNKNNKNTESVEKEIVQFTNLIVSLGITFIYIGFYITSAVFVGNFIFTLVSVAMILWSFRTLKLMYNITFRDFKHLSKQNYFHFTVRQVYALVLLFHIIFSYIGG